MSDIKDMDIQDILEKYLENSNVRDKETLIDDIIFHFGEDEIIERMESNYILEYVLQNNSSSDILDLVDDSEILEYINSNADLYNEILDDLFEYIDLEELKSKYKLYHKDDILLLKKGVLPEDESKIFDDD